MYQLEIWNSGFSISNIGDVKQEWILQNLKALRQKVLINYVFVLWIRRVRYMEFGDHVLIKLQKRT